MRLNELGRIAWEEWFRTMELRHNLELFEDEFVVMPNHVHGIIWIVNGVGARRRRAPTTAIEQFGKPVSGSIPTIIRSYKSAVTYRFNGLHGKSGSSVWQRNYYEHIIRNKTDFENIWNYIDTNPLSWQEDRLHPSVLPHLFDQDRP